MKKIFWIILIIAALVLIATMQKLKTFTNTYPKYGHASDYSWVAGKIEHYNLEGGCLYIMFSEKENNNDNYYGLLTINPQELARKKGLKQDDLVVLKGKLGKLKFSMSCPPQLYETEEILTNL